MLKAHMAKGYSFESFGADVGVSRDTLFMWAQRWADFADAKRIGQELSRKCLEGVGLGLAVGEIKGSTTAWVFMMKNMHGWQDNIAIESHGTIDVRTSSVASLEQVRAALAQDPFSQDIEAEFERKESVEDDSAR